MRVQPLTATPDEHSPLEGVKVDDRRMGHQYLVSVKSLRSGEWSEGVICYNAIAAFACMNYTRRQYPMIPVRITKVHI